jgi:hypothetical protein
MTADYWLVFNSIQHLISLIRTKFNKIAPKNPHTSYRLVPPKKRIFFQKCFPICWLYGFTTAVAQKNRYFILHQVVSMD